MEQCIRFLVNVAKYTFAKREGACICMNGLRRTITIGIYRYQELKLRPFLNQPEYQAFLLSQGRGDFRWGRGEGEKSSLPFSLPSFPLFPQKRLILRLFLNALHANETVHYPLCDEVTFIDRDPYWYSRRVREATHIRLHLNNINRDGGIEIPEAWMPTVRQHNSRSPPQRSPDGSVSSSDDTTSALDRKPPTMIRDTPITNNQGGTNSPTQQIDNIP